jgi:hypothetical protein
VRVNTKLGALVKGGAAVGVTSGAGYVALSTTTPLIGLFVIATILLGTVAVVVLTAARGKDPGSREAARRTLQTILDFVLLLARRDPSTAREHTSASARPVGNARRRPTGARRPRPSTSSRPSTIAS